MEMWQFNAKCEAYNLQYKDQLTIALQSSYYAAYWNNAGKKGKSLKHILDKLCSDKHKNTTKPINLKDAEDKFREFEELKAYGRTKIKRDSI